MEEKGYPKTSAGMKSGGQKDAAAYKETAGAGSAGMRKGAKLDKVGGTGGKDEKHYKEHCKDE